MRRREPDEYQTGFLQNGVPVCLFRPKSYRRIVTKVELGNSVTSSVAFFRTNNGGVPIDQNLLGTSNMFTGVIDVPAGQPFIVQWSAVGPLASDAFARVSWVQVDDVAGVESDFAGGVWSGSSGFIPNLSELTNLDIELIRTTESIAGPASYGPFYVGGNEYVYFEQFAAVGMQTRFRFAADAAGVNTLYDGFVHTDANVADGVMTIPQRGPYLRFEVQRAAYPGNITIRSYVAPSRINIHSRGGGANSLIEQISVNIGAGGNTRFAATAVRQGRAVWTADSLGGASFFCYLKCLEFSGTEYIIDYIGATNRASNRQVYLPSLPVQIHAFNLDGVARNFICILSYHEFDY